MKKAKSGRLEKRMGIQGMLLYLPAIIIIFGIVFYPMVYALVMSFTSYKVSKPVMDFVGFKNYIKVLKDEEFWAAVGRSLLFTVGSQIGRAHV